MMELRGLHCEEVTISPCSPWTDERALLCCEIGKKNLYNKNNQSITFIYTIVHDPATVK